MSFWLPVYGSSNVTAIKYNEATRECFVRFKNGDVYVYEDTSPEEWFDLQHTPSKGRYVQIQLRRSKNYNKVSDGGIEEE